MTTKPSKYVYAKAVRTAIATLREPFGLGIRTLTNHNRGSTGSLSNASTPKTH